MRLEFWHSGQGTTDLTHDAETDGKETDFAISEAGPLRTTLNISQLRIAT